MENKKKSHSQKFTVCIVEDEALISEMYKTKLQQEGYEVILADDGEKGLTLIKQEKPDIALIDLMMPHKDGFSLMKSLKEDSVLSKIPIIILTNLDDAETADKTADFDAAFYLIKSQYSPTDVVNIVGEVLDSGHAMKF
ncbi:MAG: response regulator [Patescibacteria group bacterium]|nr:response regulator [Patescibacteria group bacterium]